MDHQPARLAELALAVPIQRLTTQTTRQTHAGISYGMPLASTPRVLDVATCWNDGIFPKVATILLYDLLQVESIALFATGLKTGPAANHTI
jgi:hypothetical protein